LLKPCPSPFAAKYQTGTPFFRTPFTIWSDSLRGTMGYLGTCSILAALDLHNGHVTARVERRHRSREFVALLKDLDAHYPAESALRLIMDNHSAHISRETQAFLASRPNRFQYVLTPKHGSWLNIVETLFGKMARTFLRHIRVQSWEELQTRILQGIAEINAAPVVHRWKKFEALTTG
jgi:transposase